MNITPLDIRRQTFSKAFRGYSMEEVETFLEMVAEAFERLNEAHVALQNRAKHLESTLEDYRHLEKTLQDTLIMAQKIAEEAEENARKEAQLIIKESELRGDRILEEARQTVSRLKQELVTLQTERDAFVAQLKALCNGQLEFLQLFTGKEQEEAETEPADEVWTKPSDEVGTEPSDDIGAEPSDEVQVEPPIEYASASFSHDVVTEGSTLEEEQDEEPSPFEEGEE